MDADQQIIRPFPAQEKKIQFITQNISGSKPVFDTSKTGTGKTYTALWVAQRLGVKPFVVCPKSTITIWKTASQGLGVDLDDVTNYEKLRAGSHLRMRVSKAKMRDKTGKTVTIFNCQWARPEPGLVIFDEAHWCAGMTSQLAGLMIKTFRQGIPCLCLTATMAESPLKMKAAGFLLGLHDVFDYYRWIEGAGCRYVERRGWKFGTGPKALRYMAGLHERLVEEKRLTQITHDDLPNNINKGMIIPELRDIIAPRAISGLTPQDNYMEIRALVEEAKMDVFAEDAIELMDEGNSVICFVNFHKSVNKLSALFPDAGVITGHVPMDERTAIVRAFQDNSIRMLIATSPVGGVSLNLHDLDGRFPRVSLISPSCKAVEFIQVLGRTVRGGGKSTAIRKIVCAANTIEEKVYAKIKGKVNAIDTLTDGDLTTFDEQ